MIYKYIIAIILGITLQSQAQTATVQRSLNSNYQQYSNYLRQNQKMSFIDSYLSLNEKREVNSAYVEDCLMDILEQSKNSSVCDKAIFEMTRRPLNRMSSEILASLLSRIDRSPIKEKQFFNSFLNTLLITHPEIKKSLQITKKTDVLTTNSISKLEYLAWTKMLLKKVSLNEVVLLVNGKKTGSLQKYQPPQGVFQWSLITNTYEPYSFVGTWHQFASKISQQLKPFFIGGCDELEKTEIPSSEILNLEIFVNEKCLQRSQDVYRAQSQLRHLNEFPQNKTSEDFGKSTWIWPSVFIAAGLGLIAASMKNKKVSVEMPGVH